MKIPVIEMFGGCPSKGYDGYAIQGEGLHAGVPSVFVRTFGCNLRCKFGIDESNERQYHDIISSLRKEIKESKDMCLETLPVLPVGCDTYYSIFPEFRRFTLEYSVNDMFKELRKRTNDFNSNIHIVITGGEPLLPKHQLFWQQVFNMIDEYADEVVSITFETNGTYELTVHFPEDRVKVNYSISPKLKNSGESYFKTIKPKAITSYINDSYGACWFKFVGKDESIVKEIKDVIEIYGVGNLIPVYVMPEGGTKKEFDKNAETIYNVCSRNGWRYSPRHQVSVMNNGIGI